MQSGFVLICSVSLHLEAETFKRREIATTSDWTLEHVSLRLHLLTRGDFVYHRVEVIFKLQFNNCQYRFRPGQQSRPEADFSDGFALAD